MPTLEAAVPGSRPGSAAVLPRFVRHLALAALRVLPGGPSAAAPVWMVVTAASLALWPVWPQWVAAGLVLGGGAAAVGLLRVAHAPARRLLLLAVALIALGSSQWRIAERLHDALDPALEGQDLQLTGRIASLPARGPAGLRFAFEVDAATWRGEALRVGTGGAGAVPGRVSMGWFTGFHEDATLSEAQTALHAGQRWTFTVRLRQPHGARNPHGFDLERHLFQHGLRASGVVRSATGPLEGDDRATVDRLRQSVRDAVLAHTGDSRAGGVLAALAVGDQAAIARDDWDLFRDTGVSHLMAISGLHVTMFAWAAGGIVGALWRLSPRAVHWVSAPTAARLGGLMAAFVYAVFAGFGLPAQRTVLMLAVVTALAIAGRRWPWPAVLLVAGAVATVADPWALLDVGFWLSFAAVGLLMASGPAMASPQVLASLQGAAVPLPDDALRRLSRQALPVLGDALRTQWIATVGLAPLTLVLFQQVSVVGFAANLLAVPWVTLVVTPLALVGMAVPAAWTVGASAVDGLSWLLQAMVAVPGAVWHAAAVPWPVQAAALLGGALAVLPLPAPLRWLALPLMLPLLWPASDPPPPGRFELVAVDVGQGTAILVRTHRHLLVYDAGPQSGRDSNAGERLLVPLLRARGERHIDQLMLSHRDLDHVGGAASLMRAVPVRELRSSLEPEHALLERASASGVPTTACTAGQAWTWDGVRFEVLHPGPGDTERPFGGVGAGLRSNDRSCVLKVTASGFEGDLQAWPGHAGPPQALLTGDIEALAEALLVARAGETLRAPIVFAPHHGSRTSSTPAFVEAVAARWVIVQAAYRSRFGHPASAVVERWRRAGAEVVATPACGAWSWRPGDDGPRCERAEGRRHWQHPGDPAGSAEPGRDLTRR